ncbi:hypothetical protein DFJ77DRAFT_173013 [Powellomyces hirtus]|nr:hypothetical protein DFJ77DRAFT_173013 [Powellomyces hirtus]
MPATLAEPVLTLAFNNIQKLTTIDEADIQAIWNVFTKCKDNLENGRRLENISWRLWYRSCHGHSPEDDDTSPLAIPNVRQHKNTKSPYVSPESFNRILKNAVDDSNNATRRIPPELAAMKAAAAACIVDKQHLQQQQQQQQELQQLQQLQIQHELLQLEQLQQRLEAHPTPVIAPLANPAAALTPAAIIPLPTPSPPQESALPTTAAPAAGPATTACPVVPPIQRVASAVALNQTLQHLLPRNYAAVPRVASAVALNQTRLHAPVPRPASTVALNHHTAALVQRTASGQMPLYQYAAPHSPAPQFHQQQRYQHLGQQHPQQFPQPQPQPQPQLQQLLRPPGQHLQQQQQQQQIVAPQPMLPVQQQQQSKVKFFISESLTPDQASRHLPPRRLQAAAVRGSPPIPSVVPPRYDAMDSDDDCSDSDFSSDFSDSEDEDDYSDDDEISEAASTYTPVPMFQKVSLTLETSPADNASPSASLLAPGLSSRRSLLSVAIKQGGALKRAKPSQFRNLSAMGLDEDAAAAQLLDSDSESICDEMSESLRENLACERRMMPHNMRYARGVTTITSLQQTVYGDEGYW